MMRVCKILILLVLCTFTVIGQAQEDSVKTDTVRVMDNNPYRFRIRQVILPATLIGVGIIGLESHWLQYQNRELRDELRENIDSKFTVDDFSQYAPLLGSSSGISLLSAFNTTSMEVTEVAPVSTSFTTVAFACAT